MKLWFNYFCADIDAQYAFYQAVLALPEAEQSRSPIYRALETEDFQFGFNAVSAYTLLELQARRPAVQGEALAVTAYPTFMLDGPEAVDNAVLRARQAGAKMVKPPYATYYGQWQVVLSDPEGNVFRLASQGLPEGQSAPALAVPA